MSKETASTVNLRTYRNPRDPSDLLGVTKIWEAGRATAAATSFFDSIKIGPHEEEFVDGAVGANNPIRELWTEAADIWNEGPLHENIKCLVSIGTGIPSMKPFGDSLLQIGKSLIAIATETEKTAETFAKEHTRLDDEKKYFRFNVLRGLEEIGLEDAQQRNAIMAATRNYIRSEAVFKQMRACGQNLVERECWSTYA